MTVQIRVVDDQACPKCGAVWGHSDPALDFPNRPKVSMDGKTWFWACYNPECPVSYYNPETGQVDYA